MPKETVEISAGNQFSRSANQGQLADAATRTFRIILNSPSEAFDIQATCGVFVGDAHPTNTNIACTSFDAKYEGETRMVLVATFNYASEASAQVASGGGGGGANPKTISPELRPANWSISTELSEVPVRYWKPMTGLQTWGAGTPPLNPAGDMYEGVTKLAPMTTIKTTQFVIGGAGDPTAHAQYVGAINQETMTLGSLVAPPHTLMFRSFAANPAVESWGSLIFRGWTTEYTFALRVNTVGVNFPTSGPFGDADYAVVNVGWDLPVIVEGRNVKCFTPSGADLWQDPFGQPLKPGDDGNILAPAAPTLPDGLSAGARARAHIKIAGSGERSFMQVPASDPIALNYDGTPRQSNAAYPPLIQAYQIYDAIDMVQVLQLRLY